MNCNNITRKLVPECVGGGAGSHWESLHAASIPFCQEWKAKALHAEGWQRASVPFMLCWHSYENYVLSSPSKGSHRS